MTFSADPATAPARRYVVLGLGNRLLGDDALGSLVLERLALEPGPLAELREPTAVELIDGGTVGLGLLPWLVDLDGLVVVDVVDAAAEPGTLLELDGAAVMRHDPAMGVHDLGAEELLGALLAVDHLPRRVGVVGVQPGRIGLGLELSPPVAAAVPGLVAAIARHLAAWQAEDVGAEAAPTPMSVPTNAVSGRYT